MIVKYIIIGIVLILLHEATSQVQPTKESPTTTVTRPQSVNAAPKSTVAPRPLTIAKMARKVPPSKNGMLTKQSVPVQMAQKKRQQNMAPQSMIKQYNGQYIQKPSYNIHSPIPSSSINSLMNSIVGSFTNRMGKRSGKINSLDNAMFTNLNAIPDSTMDSSGDQQFNMNNIQAINDMIGSALGTALGPMQGQTPQINPTLMNSIGSFFSSNLGKSKKILDLPKQLYKSLGEKISGAGEAAVSATVPIKESFLGTLKSFYSLLKPSRSSQVDPSQYPSGLTQNDLNNISNMKRRQSFDPLQSFYYGQSINGNQKPINWQQWANTFGYANAVPGVQQIYQQPSSQQASLQSAESQRQTQYSSPDGGMFIQQQQQQQQPMSNSDLAAAAVAVGQNMPYWTRIQSIDQQVAKESSPHSGLYQRSKDLLSKLYRKVGTTQTPPIPQFPGQFLGHPPAQMQQQLSSQTLAKVQSKLGTLPTNYNKVQQQQTQPQQQQQQQQQHNPQIVSQSWSQNQPQQQQQQSQLQPSISSYYTQQPVNGYPSYPQLPQKYGGQPQPQQQQQTQGSQIQAIGQQPVQHQYINLGQVAGTVASSTQSSLLTSTSVSISKSVSTSHQQQQSQSQDQQGQSSSLQPVEEDVNSDQIQDGSAGLYYYDGTQLNSRNGDNVHQDGGDVHIGDESQDSQDNPAK